MAGLEPLISHIYHEKQQEGSMLCAQHALNAVLQGQYYTAPDLSEIAKTLDALEESYDDQNTGGSSTNMDDTGFFSVQVLDDALKVWGLNLTRWRGEEMRPYQDHPHTQLAFILNYQQHWYTLRRFGTAVPNIDADPGDGHWFNLDSCIPQPEWVGKMYLGMVLQQAEADGYSVFVVTQADPSKPLALPRTEADEIASTLPEPRSAIRPDMHSFGNTFASQASNSNAPGEPNPFEDEDLELQAALQASMMASASDDHTPDSPISPPPLRRAVVPLPAASGPPSGSGSGIQTPTEQPGRPLSPLPIRGPGLEDDPVAASMARNRAMLQRIKEEQEYAQRELWAEGLGRPRARQSGQEEDEEEMIRRAIEESEALARAQGHERPEGDDDDMDIDVEGNDAPVMRRRPLVELPTPSSGSQPGVVGDRVYDDDDAELQAALRASLEHVPEGWELPDLPPVQASTVSATPVNVATSHSEMEAEDDDSVLSDEGDASFSTIPSSETVDVPEEALSVEEIRKRRLARFGG